ncbi:hypothetical protein AM499_08530 [Bacillus sp. FJAT-22090]|nr:hypothetical protein AM499_08530 [Bacillus sp. FJAT-22090]
MRTVMKRYYVLRQRDDFFGLFSQLIDDSKCIIIPKKMIDVSLNVGDLVEINKMDRGYEIKVIKETKIYR